MTSNKDVRKVKNHSQSGAQQADKIRARSGYVGQNNPFKEAFGPQADERKKLIQSIIRIREQREALRGVSGTKERWDQLTKEMHETQTRINELNVQLGIEVKTFPAPLPKEERNAQKTGRIKPTGGMKRGEFHMLDARTPADKARYKPKSEGRSDLKNR